MSSKRPKGMVRYDNTGRVVVVTGGASGIGLAICQSFSRTGATVVCADVQPLADSIDNVHYVRCDCSVEEDCRACVEWTCRQFETIDVLVNNAAIQPADSYVPIDQMEKSVWDRLVAINFSGYTLMAKHALLPMLRQRSGVLINIASGQAHRTARQVGAYGPIKAGTIMQAKQWAVEYAREGNRAVSVSPGAIDTPLVRASLEAQGGGEALANRHPIGRIGKPEEIASAVVWLSSDDASFVTGTDLEVDGGLGAFGAFADPYPLGDDIS